MAVIEYSDYVESRDSGTPEDIDLLVIIQGGDPIKITVGQLLTLVGASVFVDGETPSGLVNDTNTVYTLASTPVVGSVKVYLNGMRMKVTEDYTISGTTLTFLIAPATGDNILIDYRI